jgi:acyl-CoA synthetase (AMP-forming)/AMP-acid ligase II
MQGAMASIYGGRTLVLQRQFAAEDWLKGVQEQKVTHSVLIPTMVKMLLDNPEFDNYDISSLRQITYGAAPMPFEVIKKAVEKFPNVRFINAFGQTETASTVTVLGPEDHDIPADLPEAEKEKKLRRLASSIGKPLPDTEVKVFDEITGEELPAGQPGEIWARGPRAMSGYWNMPEATASTKTEDGWVRTGDLGYYDEDGYFYLSGRAKDIIIRGGENISPEEIENILYSHPQIDEAAVIGVPDEEWGEVIRAVVVAKEGESPDPAEIMEFCRQRLASFKRPTSVVFVDELPRNPMGKVLKRVLRDEYGQP